MKDEEKGSRKSNTNYSESRTTISLSKREKNSTFPKTFKEADEFYNRMQTLMTQNMDPDQRKRIFDLMHKVIIFLNDFLAGNIQLGEIVSKNRKNTLRDFEMWMAQLEVYGSKYHVKEHQSQPFFVST